MVSGAAVTGTCGWSNADACGATGGVCCGAGTAARAVEVRAGAVPAGSKEAGLCAVWQAEADTTSTASMATRIWSFATRIFLYEIRSALRGLDPVHSIKNRTPRSRSGQRGKGTAAVTFGTRPNGYRRILLLRRRKSHKGLIPKGGRFSGPVHIGTRRFRRRSREHLCCLRAWVTINLEARDARRPGSFGRSSSTTEPLMCASTAFASV